MEFSTNYIEGESPDASRSQWKRIVFVIFLGIFFIAIYFLNALRPIVIEEKSSWFEIKSGEGFRGIAYRLEQAGLVRSSLAFSMSAILTGAARELKPGLYPLSPSSGTLEIIEILTVGIEREVTVVIPEGSTIYDIDNILSGGGVIRSGELIRYGDEKEGALEGSLFPDSYRFFIDTPIEEVVARLQNNLEEKTKELGISEESMKRVLIIASLLEKEVPDFEDRRVVAGILERRMRIGMPLQVDATICYVKELKTGKPVDCYPITVADLKVDSPYNTYLYKGLPPGPIGNPGLMAIEAALKPKSSEYLFYLSDPKTQKTIFSRTLDEHAKNRIKYLTK